MSASAPCVHQTLQPHQKTGPSTGTKQTDKTFQQYLLQCCNSKDSHPGSCCSKVVTGCGARSEAPATQRCYSRAAYLHASPQAQGFSSKLPIEPQAWPWALHSVPAVHRPATYCHQTPCPRSSAISGVMFGAVPQFISLIICAFSHRESERQVQTQDKTQSQTDNRKHKNTNNWNNLEVRQSDQEKFSSQIGGHSITSQHNTDATNRSEAGPL